MTTYTPTGFGAAFMLATLLATFAAYSQEAPRDGAAAAIENAEQKADIEAEIEALEPSVDTSAEAAAIDATEPYSDGTNADAERESIEPHFDGTDADAERESIEPGVDTSAEAAEIDAVDPRRDAANDIAESELIEPTVLSAVLAADVTRSQSGGQVMDRMELGRTEITGNQELPKVLYIVPWQKANPGDLMGRPVNTLLDEVLAPLDREEFVRTVDYYGDLYGEEGE